MKVNHHFFEKNNTGIKAHHLNKPSNERNINNLDLTAEMPKKESSWKKPLVYTALAVAGLVGAIFANQPGLFSPYPPQPQPSPPSPGCQLTCPNAGPFGNQNFSETDPSFNLLKTVGSLPEKARAQDRSKEHIYIPENFSIRSKKENLYELIFRDKIHIHRNNLKNGSIDQEKPTLIEEDLLSLKNSKGSQGLLSDPQNLSNNMSTAQKTVVLSVSVLCLISLIKKIFHEILTKDPVAGWNPIQNGVNGGSGGSGGSGNKKTDAAFFNGFNQNVALDNFVLGGSSGGFSSIVSNRLSPQELVPGSSVDRVSQRNERIPVAIQLDRSSGNIVVNLDERIHSEIILRFFSLSQDGQSQQLSSYGFSPRDIQQYLNAGTIVVRQGNNQFRVLRDQQPLQLAPERSELNLMTTSHQLGRAVFRYDDLASLGNSIFSNNENSFGHGSENNLLSYFTDDVSPSLEDAGNLLSFLMDEADNFEEGALTMDDHQGHFWDFFSSLSGEAQRGRNLVTNYLYRQSSHLTGTSNLSTIRIDLPQSINTSGRTHLLVHTYLDLQNRQRIYLKLEDAAPTEVLHGVQFIRNTINRALFGKAQNDGEKKERIDPSFVKKAKTLLASLRVELKPEEEKRLSVYGYQGFLLILKEKGIQLQDNRLVDFLKEHPLLKQDNAEVRFAHEVIINSNAPKLKEKAKKLMLKRMISQNKDVEWTGETINTNITQNEMANAKKQFSTDIKRSLRIRFNEQKLNSNSINDDNNLYEFLINLRNLLNSVLNNHLNDDEFNTVLYCSSQAGYAIALDSVNQDLIAITGEVPFFIQDDNINEHVIDINVVNDDVFVTTSYIGHARFTDENNNFKDDGLPITVKSKINIRKGTLSAETKITRNKNNTHDDFEILDFEKPFMKL